MLKLFQFATMVLEVWFTTIALPDWLTVAEPETTLAPVGSAFEATFGSVWAKEDLKTRAKTTAYARVSTAGRAFACLEKDCFLDPTTRLEALSCMTLSRWSSIFSNFHKHRFRSYISVDNRPKLVSTFKLTLKKNLVQKILFSCPRNCNAKQLKSVDPN